MLNKTAVRGLSAAALTAALVAGSAICTAKAQDLGFANATLAITNTTSTTATIVDPNSFWSAQALTYGTTGNPPSFTPVTYQSYGSVSMSGGTAVLSTVDVDQGPLGAGTTSYSILYSPLDASAFELGSTVSFSAELDGHSAGSGDIEDVSYLYVLDNNNWQQAVTFQNG